MQLRVAQEEKKDFEGDLSALPKTSSLRRINELAKRARSVNVHAYIILYLQEQLPAYFGQGRKQVYGGAVRDSVLTGFCVYERGS